MSRQANFASQSYFNYYQNWQIQETEFENFTSKVGLAPFKTSEMLHISNFGFQIPEDSYIDGIIVKVSGSSQGEGYIRERAVKIVNDKGEIIGNNKSGKA